MSKKNIGQRLKAQKAVQQAAQWSAGQKLEGIPRKYSIGQMVRLKNNSVAKVTGIGGIGYILEGINGQVPASALKPADDPP